VEGWRFPGVIARGCFPADIDGTEGGWGCGGGGSTRIKTKRPYVNLALANSEAAAVFP